jgi:hypothetical protein
MVDILQNSRHNTEILDVFKERDGTDGQDGQDGQNALIGSIAIYYT